MWEAGTWPCAQVGSLFHLEEESQRVHTGPGNMSILIAAHYTGAHKLQESRHIPHLVHRVY